MTKKNDNGADELLERGKALRLELVRKLELVAVAAADVVAESVDFDDIDAYTVPKEQWRALERAVKEWREVGDQLIRTVREQAKGDG